MLTVMLAILMLILGPAANHVGYGGPHLVAHPNGAVVPVDEPAVVAARAAHLAALAQSGH